MVKNTASTATHQILQKSATLSRTHINKSDAASNTIVIKSTAPAKKINILTDDDEIVTESASESIIEVAPEPVIKPIIEQTLPLDSKPVSEPISIPDVEDLAVITAAAREEAANIITKAVEEKPLMQPTSKPVAAKRLPKRLAKPVVNHTKKQAKTTEKACQAKDRAIRKALKSAAAVGDAPVFRPKHTGRKVLLAVSCSALVVAGLAVFVKVNMPDISVRVAAFQSGIEATYPSYVPRGYALDGVSSEQANSVTIKFINQSNNSSFSITEESSSWDSNALLTNYVKANFASSYITLREQGITIYVDNSRATWVNGGILYKLSCDGTNLTKEQIRNIAVSL